jgi:hypothetical protein
MKEQNYTLASIREAKIIIYSHDLDEMMNNTKGHYTAIY